MAIIVCGMDLNKQSKELMRSGLLGLGLGKVSLSSLLRTNICCLMTGYFLVS
jgi:hypothetical protein